MREILFRGKRKNGGKWAVGSLIQAEKYCCILESEEALHPMDYPYLYGELGTFDGYATPIISETVGQYTGLTDKNGKKIFEGDIMRNAGNVVEFSVGSFCINGDCPLSLWTKTAIIGNIHDNPELLKGGAE